MYEEPNIYKNPLLHEPKPYEKAMQKMRSKYPEFGQNGFCPTDIGSATSPPDNLVEEQFNEAVRILRILSSILKKNVSSYELKHKIERLANISYISNGVVIAAADYLGFTVRRIKGSPNATISFPIHLSLH